MGIRGVIHARQQNKVIRYRHRPVDQATASLDGEESRFVRRRVRSISDEQEKTLATAGVVGDCALRFNRGGSRFALHIAKQPVE
jgi:hypothetical protein